MRLSQGSMDMSKSEVKNSKVWSSVPEEERNWNNNLADSLFDVAPYLITQIKKELYAHRELFEQPLLSVLAVQDDEGNFTELNRVFNLLGLPKQVKAKLVKRLQDYSTNKESDPFSFLSDIEEEDIDWLAEDFIQRGVITLIQGEMDKGKSTLTSDISAQVSQGGEVFGHKVTKGNVIYLSAEDSPAKVIKPRVKVAGGNVEKILALNSSDLPMFPENIELLYKAVLTHKPTLIVIDPILAMFEGDMNKETDVRKVLQSLRILAEDFNIAVLIVSHTGKMKHKNPVHNSLGSQGFGATVRGVMQVACEEDSLDRYCTVIKNNNGSSKPSWKFRFETIKGFSAPKVSHLGLTEIKAQDIGAYSDTLTEELKKDILEFVSEREKIEAKALTEYFSNDPRVSKSMKTFEYARAELCKSNQLIKDVVRVESKNKTYYSVPVDDIHIGS